MNLNIKKVSVPVLMFMMFQSGFSMNSTDAWFGQAAKAVAQGKVALAAAKVIANDNTVTVKGDHTTEWENLIKEEVDGYLPGVYTGSTTPTKTALNEKVRDNTNGFGTLDGTASKEITVSNANSIVKRLIAEEGAYNNTNAKWNVWIQNGTTKGYIEGDTGWAKAVIDGWGTATEELKESLFKKQGGDSDSAGVVLRHKIGLDKTETYTGEVKTVYDKVKAVISETDADKKKAAVVKALREGLEEVLLDRITKEKTNSNWDTFKENVKNDVDGYVKVHYYRNFEENSELSSNEGLLKQLWDSSDLREGFDSYVGSEIEKWLRRDKSLSDAQQKAMVGALDSAAADDAKKAELKPYVQELDNGSADLIVDLLKAIKKIR